LGGPRAAWRNQSFLRAPPSKVAATLFTLFADGEIWTHIEATFEAALLGLALGVIVGAVLGAGAALMPYVGEILDPVMTVLNAVPRIILAPLFVIWFGIGIASKVAVTFVLIAVLFFFTVYSGIKEVDQRLVDRVRTLGGGRAVLLREVYLPAVTAWALSQLKVAVGFAFTGAVVGEFVASSRGLSSRSRRALLTPRSPWRFWFSSWFSYSFCSRSPEDWKSGCYAGDKRERVVRYGPPAYRVVSKRRLGSGENPAAVSRESFRFSPPQWTRRDDWKNLIGRIVRVA
jgi:NitT/TauT family transport system permease protein